MSMTVEKVKKWFDSELSMREEESLDSVECEEVKEICLKALEEVQKYRAIGTVSEFRELKEKATAKKPRFYAHNYHCKECGNLVGNNEFEWQRFEYCDKCGQKLDWSEGKE